MGASAIVSAAYAAPTTAAAASLWVLESVFILVSPIFLIIYALGYGTSAYSLFQPIGSSALSDGLENSQPQ
jgi:hypothetical protein